MDGRIDLLCGSGIREFTRRKDGIDLVGELEKQYDFVRSVDGIDAAKGKVIWHRRGDGRCGRGG